MQCVILYGGHTPRAKKTVSFCDTNQVGYFHTVGWVDEQGKTRRIGVGSIFEEVSIPSTPGLAPIATETGSLVEQNIPQPAPSATPIRNASEAPHGGVSPPLPPAGPATTPTHSQRGTAPTSSDLSL